MSTLMITALPCSRIRPTPWSLISHLIGGMMNLDPGDADPCFDGLLRGEMLFSNSGTIPRLNGFE
jgi:hypothetical protein